MVNVFQVDSGIMMTFDVSFALKSVSELAQEIEKACGIPIEKQVLIVSGGEGLDPNNRVCVYSAGTDSNPFYLFERLDYDCEEPDYDFEVPHDVDMRQEVLKAQLLPPSYETVEHRALLAKKFYALALEQVEFCNQLVYDQHRQQQERGFASSPVFILLGWAACMANMDDCVNNNKQNLDFLEKTVRNHVSKIDHYKNLLATFNEVLVKLAEVPLPPALLVGGGAFMEDLITSLKSAGKSGIADDVSSSQANPECSTFFERNQAFGSPAAQPPERPEEEPMVVSKKSASSSSLNVDMSLKGDMEASLLQWIHHHDEKGTMKMLVDNCERGLRQFDEDLLADIIGERVRLEAERNAPQLEDIKGLEVRLFTLEEFMREAKVYLQKQTELSQFFAANHSRAAAHHGDPSIFPDLCIPHAGQMDIMEENHRKLQDIKRRCCNAKKELSSSIFHRLKWIVYIESRCAQLSCKLNITNEGLKRLELNLELLSELHAAPQKYLMAVGEVVRRRTFSSAFLKFGEALSTQMQSIYSEEIARRKEFDNNFKDHFVRLMFPGLDDCPLPFATEPPQPIDEDLPKLSLSDLEMIRSKLPDVAKVVPAPEITDTMSHLMSVVATCLEPAQDKPSFSQETGDRESRQTDPDTGVQPLKMRKIAPTSLKDDRGFESETDTEEFENVGQSPVELVFDARRGASSAPGTTVEELTAVPADDSRFNLRELGEAAAALVRLLRSDLVELRQKVDAEGKNIPAMMTEFRTSWDVVQAFIKRNPPIQEAETNTEETSMAETETAKASDGEARVAELEKLVEEYRKREQELREQLLQRDAKDEDFKRVTGELERRLEDVEKYRAHCDELQRRLDDNLESRLWEPNQEMESSYQDQLQRLEEEKRVLADLAARAATDKDNVMRELEKLKQSLLTAEGKKNAALKEQAAKLLQEHRAEVANIRSRFKLMTKSTMERSPSESSLEAEKVDMAEMSKDIAQMTERMAKERDAKIREAIMVTKKEMELKMKTELKSMQMKMEAEKQVWFTDTMRRIMSDKELQISTLMEREAQLKVECSKLKKMIQSITDTNASFVVGTDHQLAASKIGGVYVPSKHSPLTVSDIEKFHRTLTRSTCALLQREIKTTSCMPGDVVQVVWDDAHSNYVVIQHRDTLHFVHHESLPALGLPTVKAQGVPAVPTSCLAQVLDKEYCHAKKTENRYHVERGTKFYRVKLAPLKSEPLVTTASQCDPQALHCLESSQNVGSEPSVSIIGSGPPSAISDDEPPHEAADVPS